MKHLYRDSFQPYRPALILSQQQVTQKINFQLFSSYLDNFRFSFAQTCYCKTFSADSELKGSLFFTRNIPRCLSSKGLCTTVFVFHSISSIRYPPVITQILFLVDIMTKKKTVLHHYMYSWAKGALSIFDCTWKIHLISLLPIDLFALYCITTCSVSEQSRNTCHYYDPAFKQAPANVFFTVTWHFFKQT